MKTSANNPTGHFFRLALLSLVLGTSIFTSACSDSGSSQDDQAQTQTSDDDNKKDEQASSKQDGEETAEKKDDKNKEKQPIPVEIAKVARGDIPQTYRSITTLEAEQSAQVVARSTGLLQSIKVEEGDRVEKGQLLAQLDVEQLNLEVEQLEATTSKLKKEFDRQQSLFSRNLTSSDSLDRAKFEYQSQLAQLKLSKLRQEYASIKAPISGVVTERLVKTGNLIRDNDILFKIVDLSSLKAVLHLPEKEMAHVRKSQPVFVKIDAVNEQIIQGEVERIRPQIDNQTGTFKVVANLQNPEESLKSGMFGKVELVFDVHQNTLLLEQQAIISLDNRSHVFVVKNNKAIQTPVTLGFKHDGLVEVLTGLQESDQVITTGQQLLKHDALVEVINQEPSLAKASSQDNAGDAATGLAVNP